MDIEIVCRDFTPSGAIRDHVHYRLARLLAWNRRDIDHVVVTLWDAHGPMNVRGTRCRIVVTLSDGDQVFVEHVDRGLYAAISHATDRIEREVREEFSRRRGRRPRRSLATMWQ